MISEKDMLAQLETDPISLPPLSFKYEKPDRRQEDIDAFYEVTWNKRTYRFVAELKARGTPQAILTAAHQAKSLAYDLPGTFPLVVVPYLSPGQLEQVERIEGVSAVDLCGNGIVRGGNEFVVFRSGRPNRFREIRPIKAAYRGTSALVARALVLRPTFDRVSDLHEFIGSHGGRITMGTVSKALTRLGEDLVVAREGRAIHVVQPDKLMDKLRESYRPPTIKARWAGKVQVSEADLHAMFLGRSERVEARVVLTGVASATFHVAIATEPVAAFYSTMEPQALLRAARVDAVPSRTFPNVEILQTDDESVYFDQRMMDQRIVSSPVQTWLELATGDKRTREAAAPLRARLLEASARFERMSHGR